MKDLYIIPECYVDTSLVESVLQTEGVNHQKGCFTVAGVMSNKYKDRFAIGVIDFDKSRPLYMKEFIEIGATEHVALMKHKDRPHFVIYIKPAMDGFILSCSKEVGIKIEDYGLPTDLKNFTRATKTVTTKEDQRFKTLFRDLKEANELKIFTRLLNYLKTYKFEYKEDELKKIILNSEGA